MELEAEEGFLSQIMLQVEVEQAVDSVDSAVAVAVVKLMAPAVAVAILAVALHVEAMKVPEAAHLTQVKTKITEL